MHFLYRILFFLILPSALSAQVQFKALTLKRFIEKTHYAPRPVNDDFSRAVFLKVLDEIDPFRLYLDASQLVQLEKYQTTIDDELNGKTGNFCKDLAALYHKSLVSGETIAKDLLLQPFKYEEPLSFQYGKQASFARDQAALKQRWHQYLKWRILARIYEQWDLIAEDSAGAVLPLVSSEWFRQKEAESRKLLVKRVNERLKNHTEIPLAETEEMLNKVYLHTIAQCFDPHTDYFDSENKKAFSESLSSDLLEFGFSMEATEEGEILVSEIKPGSAAWNSGNMYADDKIVQVKTANGKIVNAKEAGYEAISIALDEAGSEEIEITLRSADGNIREVKLAKQEAKNEENLVRGYLLNGSRKIGYIGLPSFYTSWDENGGLGCANDLAKEIIKLKRENIEGLVLDLRYNGGGSLREAVEIAGIFIEAGPMLLTKDAAGNRQTVKDPSRGSIFDGPLLVMINGQSASASELVAATLQDYKRAIVVGGSSFGKATMQQVFPLDTSLIVNRSLDEAKINPNKKYSDYVKVTTGKLYRINGSSNQQNGVIPDALFPDAFAALPIIEKNLEHSLPPDTIGKTLQYSPVLNLYPVEKIPPIQKEINSSPYFAALTKWISDLGERKKNNKVPLDWQGYAAYEKSGIPPLMNDYENDSFSAGLKVENTNYTKRLMELENEYVKESNKWVLDDLVQDPYIRAAYYLLSKIF